MCCSLLMPSRAYAQDTDGAVRLSLDGVLFAGEFSAFEGPAGAEFDTTNTNAGLYAGSFGLGLGYALGKNAVIGTRLIHGTNKFNSEGDTLPEASITRFSLLPYAEYVATASSTIQPFVAGTIGFQIGSNDTSGVESTTSAFLFGLSAGLHLFATDTFSVDPHFSYYRASGTASAGTQDVDYGANVFLLGFSLSGWIGGGADVKSADSETTEAPEPEVAAVSHEASVPEPSSSPPPVRLELKEEGELLTGAVTLDSGQLTLLGRPTLDAENIAVRVTVRGDELKNCRAGTLIAGDQRFELRNVIGRAKEHGSMTVVVLQGTIGPQELSAFSDAEVARIGLCGHVITLSTAHREAIAQYYEQFRHRAVEANTWDAPAAPNSEKAPASAPAASAPTRSQPSGSSGQTSAPAKPAPGTTATPSPTAPSKDGTPTRSFDAP